MEAGLELTAFWGLQNDRRHGRETEELVISEPQGGPKGVTPVIATLEPGLASHDTGETRPVSPKLNLADLPYWLNDEYVATHPCPWPDGIRVPGKETSTYEQVVINKDLPEEEREGFRRLIQRHRGLFNDGKGCAREPMEHWLRIPISNEKEVNVRPRPPYRLSPRNEQVVDAEFDDHVQSGRLSRCESSPFGLQVFVVWRNGKPRPVVDMRPLNALVPADAYPLPRQERIIDVIKVKEYLSTCDITAAFYQRMIHPADRHRAGVVSHRGPEMFKVAIMGYKTSPQHQQRFMDRNFQHIAWRTMACFVDDLITFSGSYLQHLADLDEVFCILEDLGLTLKAKKTFVGFRSLELLGYLVDRLGLTTTESKTRAMSELALPETLGQLEYFIGLTNWNRHLIPLYGQKCEPLQAVKTKLLALGPRAGQARKAYAAKTKIADHVDVGTDSVFYQAFHSMKKELSEKPALYHFYPDRELYIFVDASKERGIGAAAYQMSDPSAEYCKTKLRPILFLSRTLTTAETRYWPTELEFSGLVWAVKKLTTYIEQTHATVVTDHKPSVDIANMTGLATSSTARANLRLQTWAIFLSQYADRITVTYTRGKDMEVPDALSRMRTEVTEQTERILRSMDDLRPEGPMADLEVDSGLWGEPTEEETGVTVETSDSFLKRVREACTTSKRISHLVRQIEQDGAPDVAEADVKTREGSSFILVRNGGSEGHDKGHNLYFTDPVTGSRRLVVPTTELKKEILTLAHDRAGHPGLLRTYKRAAKGFYWRSMVDSIKQYIAHCRPCQRNKNRNHRPYALLRPIESPPAPFHTMTVDLITDLLEDEGCDTIMTVTDKFTKAVKFLPGRKDDSSKDWSLAFYDPVVNAGWGYPRVLISDRDPRFLSALWRDLLRMGGASSIATTAYHPAGDGQSERTNQTLEVVLRFHVGYGQSGWVTSLPFLETTLNNMESFTTKIAPNELLYGQKVRTALDLGAAEGPAASEIAETREALRHEAATSIKIAQEQMAVVHNRKHAEPDFSSGFAFVSLRAGYTLPGIKKRKLAAQRMGPFRILRKVGRGAAYELELPAHYKLHPVISVVHLELALAPNSDPYRRDPAPIEPIVTEKGGEEWEIEALLEKRVAGKGKRRRTEYLVRWKGWAAEYDQWVDKRELGNAKR